MASYMWVLEVRPGCEDEYKRRHDEIWPELVAEIRQSGIRNYNIFRHGLHLFGYFETDDFEKSRHYLANSEANRRWGASMAPLMKIEVDPRTNFPYLLPLQWRMD